VTPNPATWHPDPTGRHERRYWDGVAWTDHVWTAGQQSKDPLVSIAEPQDYEATTVHKDGAHTAKHTSHQAQRAHDQAMHFLDRFFDSLDDPRSGVDLDGELSRQSAEVRMLVWERLIDGNPTKKPDAEQRIPVLVHHLMREGKGTVSELQADLASMSLEGRAHAFSLLTSHPDYKLKGLRWPGVAPYAPDLSFGGSLTTYQILVDAMRSVVDTRWCEAMTAVDASKRQAEEGDWSGASSTIQRAVNLLEDLSRTVSTLYWQDLAAAFFYLEAYLGNSGDRAGAQTAIGKALTLLSKLRDSSPDDSIQFDLAKVLGSHATIFAESGDLSEALRGQSASITLLERLAEDDWHAFGPELAGQLAQQALFLLHAGDLDAAGRSVDSALRWYDRLAKDGARIDPRAVDLAHGLQAAIQATGG